MEGSEDRIAAEDGPSPRANAEAEPDAQGRSAVFEAEAEALKTRRAHEDIDLPPDAPTIGLALSGGGIRSATFCLGLLRGLAQRGVLKRFDYLSTVSGGGYIGAMFGRLVSTVGIQRAEALLESSDSVPLSWLRRYGRYLAPLGARDFGIGIATYLRAIIAVHLEFAMMAVTVGLVAVMAYGIDAQVGLLDAGAWAGWGSAWWPLAAAYWLVSASGLLVLYWMVRAGDAGEGQPAPARIGIGDVCLTIIVGIIGAALVLRWGGQQELPLPAATWSLAGGLVLLGIGLRGLRVFILLESRRLGFGRFRISPLGSGRLGSGATTAAPPTLSLVRRELTEALRLTNVIVLILAGLGLLDWLSWKLHVALSTSFVGLFGGLGLGGAVLLAMRALSEPLQRGLRSSEGASGDILPRLVNVAGYTLAFGLLLLWTTLVQHLVYGGFSLGDCVSNLRGWPCDFLGETISGGALGRLLLVLLVPLVWFFGTGWNAENANASSLHNMYAARLARAYLGAANKARFGGEAGLQASAGDSTPESLSDVTEVDDSDDVPLHAHRPPDGGGPIHLINVCLNQTRGHQTRLYNADRKGVPMVLSAYGVEIGHKPLRDYRPERLGGLARWVAISGAAASPGAGVNTTPGWAALLFLAGARLGYWLNLGGANATLDVADQPDSTLPQRARARLKATKMGRLYSEFRASYDGPLAPEWYLSDGGHFDNTGVHPLLQRQLDVIVLADCGADPRFEYADLENLVRKARIDYGAEIEFYRAEDANRRFGQDRPATSVDAPTISFLSPQELVNNHSARGVLLARILYRADAAGHRREGTLLVIKPNMHTSLDVDIQAYAKRRPAFPQQSTGDQFFDEAQWESYHRLGEDFGAALGVETLENLRGWRERVVLEPGAQKRIGTCSLTLPKEEDRPFWKIETRKAAVGALSIGALLAVLAPLWQAMDHWRQTESSRQTSLAKTLGKAEDIFLRTARQVDRHATYQAMHARLVPAKTAICGTETDAVKAFDALDRYLVSDPKARALSRDFAPILADLRKAAHAQNPDIAALSNALRDFASLLRVRQAELDLPSRHSDLLVFAQLHSQARRIDGESSETQIAATFMDWARATCGDDRTSAVGALCGQIREREPDKLDPHDYWVRLRKEVAPPKPEPSASGPIAAATPRIVDDALCERADSSGKADTKAAGSPRDVAAAMVHGQLLAACSGPPKSLYVQIYDEPSRGIVAGLDWSALRPALTMHGIENVSISAAARGARMPDFQRVPKLVVHDLENDQACAGALTRWITAQPHDLDSGQRWPEIRVVGLPKGHRGRKGVIELWWPALPSHEAQ